MRRLSWPPLLSKIRQPQIAERATSMLWFSSPHKSPVVTVGLKAGYLGIQLSPSLLLSASFSFSISRSLSFWLFDAPLCFYQGCACRKCSTRRVACDYGLHMSRWINVISVDGRTEFSLLTTVCSSYMTLLLSRVLYRSQHLDYQHDVRFTSSLVWLVRD